VASAVARAYNEGLGAVPSAGFRGRASGQGASRAKPLKTEALVAFGRSTEAANLAIFLRFRNANKTATGPWMTLNAKIRDLVKFFPISGCDTDFKSELRRNQLR